MHASMDRRNLTRTVLAALVATSALSAVSIVPAGDPRGPVSNEATWLRVSFADITARPEGHTVGGALLHRADVLVTVEVFARSLAQAAGGSVDTVDGVASTVAAALRGIDRPLVNYVADNTGATAVTGYAVRAVGVPTMSPPEMLDDYQRVIVRATVASWAEV